MRKLICSLVVTSSLFAWGGMGHHYQGRYGNCANYNQMINNLNSSQKYNLTERDKNSLLYMYQEEKIARDVYITLGNKWNLRIFKNISQSEQRHMDAVKAILNKYNIPIPNIDGVGVFANNDFQNLYNELVNKGLKSQKDALEVGKQIEVLDIKDLKERMENTTPDIEKVFSFLEMGSEHHLNAFTRWLGY